jgi:hypothetical protein
MKTLFTLLAFILSVTSAHADITAVGQQKLQSIELLTNPGFENGKARWTNVGGTFNIVTSGSNFLGIGKSSATWQASAGSQYLESETVTVPVALQGKACGASFQTFGGDGNLQLQAYDNSNNVLSAALTLQAQTVATPVQITFRCPSSGGVKYRLQSTAASALIALDAGHLGDQGLYQVQQAQLIGSALVTGCAGNWSTTSTTFGAFSAATGCTYSTQGSASAPGTQIPAITFPSLPAGNYQIVVSSNINVATSNASSAGPYAFYKITDGTNSSNIVTSSASNPGAGTQQFNYSFPSMVFNLNYTTQQSNVTLQVQAKVNTSSFQTTSLSNSATDNFLISVYYYPNTSQTAYRADTTPASISGYVSGATWTASSSSFVDPTISGTPSVTVRNSRNFGTPTMAPSNQAGITWTPPRPGNYWFCATISMFSNTAQNIYAQLYDGTNVLATVAGYGNANTGGGSFPSVRL